MVFWCKTKLSYKSKQRFFFFFFLSLPSTLPNNGSISFYRVFALNKMIFSCLVRNKHLHQRTNCVWVISFQQHTIQHTYELLPKFYWNSNDSYWRIAARKKPNKFKQKLELLFWFYLWHLHLHMTLHSKIWHSLCPFHRCQHASSLNVMSFSN